MRFEALLQAVQPDCFAKCFAGSLNSNIEPSGSIMRKEICSQLRVLIEFGWLYSLETFWRVQRFNSEKFNAIHIRWFRYGCL